MKMVSLDRSCAERALAKPSGSHQRPERQARGLVAFVIRAGPRGRSQHQGSAPNPQRPSRRPACSDVKSGHSKMARRGSWSTPLSHAVCRTRLARMNRCTDREFRMSKRARSYSDRPKASTTPAPSFGAGRGDGAVRALRSIAGRLLSAPCAIHRAEITHMAATIDFQLQPS